ncbi:uncharacterized protein E6C27_scaffold89G005790 [Cucumis melo var. makuwa]|uniref:CGL160/ATPI domain-containing protein n=1 Tax=Cucumis melo var. makuwa TaxID=1194695 RepID=A0A5A7V5F8_CUCMM|nr:uncharacterized protein E6C27_scaffold89G005790 [Cucumis melo var. makuwa]
MAVLNYISATSTPISQDSSISPPIPDPRQTKVILPKKKPEKWSTGIAPGDYGGPPTTTKLRKYWGGEKDDPLTSDDYIWNREFMGRMKKFVKDQPDDLSHTVNKPKDDKPSGFLSLNRVTTLDSLDVDLSKELSAPPMPRSEDLVEKNIPIGHRKSPRWKLAPTRHEQEKWDRAYKAATGGSDVMFQELRRPQGDPEALAALSMEQYFKLKKKMQILTLAIGGVGLISAYVSYSPEVAARFV